MKLGNGWHGWEGGKNDWPRASGFRGRGWVNGGDFDGSDVILEDLGSLEGRGG